MHRSRHVPLQWGMVMAAACLSTVTGCSHSDVSGKAASSSARSSSVANLLPPGAIGVSPAGVTTRVDVPADSTEEQYFQACHAAREWMVTQQSTRESLIERYLAMVQASPSGVAGSWNIRWADLTPARQSAVIVAAVAAANNECG
ncbi:lipoprotein LpqV [Mycobacterium simulans]|uniref:lipoprotein LpqV n=1 Tax=Mycobacterium simulans TaxID=627089 RepID=UPI00163ED687|nr:lipoprotein LpqV [Mycobacterium simulans]